MPVSYTKDALCVQNELPSLFFTTYYEGLFVRRIMGLVPIFILETHNQTNYKCLPKFVQTDDATVE